MARYQDLPKGWRQFISYSLVAVAASAITFMLCLGRNTTVNYSSGGNFSANTAKLEQIYSTLQEQYIGQLDSQALIDAAIAIEDKRFYEHQGVDWVTTIKACARMFFGDDSVGGSSITQQLIKNVLLTEDEGADDVTVQRKVLEIFRAVQLEKRYDKDEILELYLNFIYLGQGCRGVKSAAAAYFGKELEKLIDERVKAILNGEGTKPSKWAEKEIEEAMALGITDGTNPKGYATRQETAAMVLRAHKLG